VVDEIATKGASLRGTAPSEVIQRQCAVPGQHIGQRLHRRSDAMLAPRTSHSAQDETMILYERFDGGVAYKPWWLPSPYPTHQASGTSETHRWRSEGTQHRDLRLVEGEPVDANQPHPVGVTAVRSAQANTSSGDRRVWPGSHPTRTPVTRGSVTSGRRRFTRFNACAVSTRCATRPAVAIMAPSTSRTTKRR